MLNKCICACAICATAHMTHVNGLHLTTVPHAEEEGITSLTYKSESAEEVCEASHHRKSVSVVVQIII